MVLYEKLGYNSFEEYEKDFMNNLLITNHNFDFFVNWEKIYDKLRDNLTEISILNGLNKVDSEELENEFRKIITYYPEVVPILPSILAIRYERNNECIVEIFDGEFKEYDFNDETYNVEDIIYFSKKTGLLDLFNKITDLYTYLLGTEVGIDTNGRKNRSGTTYETLLEQLLNSELKEFEEYTVSSQEYVNHINRNKKADFIIYNKDKQVIVLECNFYNATGSKPIETANAYVDLQNQLSNYDLTFIWVTDGKGWNKMEKTLLKVSPNIDYLLNYKLLQKNLKSILDLE